MNKSKMMLSAIGGVFGLLSLVMAFLLWGAISQKTAALEGDDEEGTAGLETVRQDVANLSRKSVYPSAESVKAIEGNRMALDDWQEDALQQVNGGDRAFPPVTPAAFKAGIIADTTNEVYKGLVKPDFAFGPFRPYIREGMLPQEKDLPLLQRQWYDLTCLMTNLAACGIAEIVDIQVKPDEAPANAGNAGPANAGAGKRPNRPGVRGAAADKAVDAPKRTRQTYILTFTTRPAGFVKGVNRLAKMERFAVVEDFAFSRAKDAIATTLVAEKAEEGGATGRSRRRRRAAQAAAEAEASSAAKQGVVTDPAQDDPFSVTLTVSVYDFGSRAGGTSSPADEKEGK